MTRSCRFAYFSNIFYLSCRWIIIIGVSRMIFRLDLSLPSASWNLSLCLLIWWLVLVSNDFLCFCWNIWQILVVAILVSTIWSYCGSRLLYYSIARDCMNQKFFIRDGLSTLLTLFCPWLTLFQVKCIISERNIKLAILTKLCPRLTIIFMLVYLCRLEWLMAIFARG